MSQSLLATLLVGLGIFLAIDAVQRRARRRVKNLRDALEIVYLDGDESMSPSEVSNLLARAGLVAERAFGDSGMFARVARKVEQSDWRVSAGEFVAVSACSALGGMLLGILAGSPVLGAVLAAVGAFVPYIVVTASVARRRKKFESQFPDVLDLMAASLESGSSVSQGIELIVKESDDPAASEFGRVLSATRLGAPLVDSLRTMGERIGSRDLDWTVQAIIVQQRTGGRLAEVLRTVADFMRARDEVRRELRALTAEGKLSAFVLGLLPFVVAGFVKLSSPDYLDPLFTTKIGIVMTIGALTSMGLGFFVMSRMIKVEV